MFQKVRIVLMNPSHPGNIGAAARAMKTMGFSELHLVKPGLFPHEQATARAAGADTVLASARVVDNLTAALKGCNLVFGTSARARTLSWPVKTARECAEQVVRHRGDIAIVFGRERSGLTNEELAQCQYHVTIPTEAAFSSLNLAQAVQILTYEMRMAKLNAVDPGYQDTLIQQLATADQMEGFYVHLEKTLLDIKFIDPRQPKMLMKRLRRLFNRAQIDKTELNILRGILASIHRRDNC
ncbi:tRNA (cytosine(32)/uridine(32)-2'-O)-methyltransferase TrmJ [Coxiella endosymbiont of Ornithodoros maritimus]|uniref:tRNA (cytosine(32)/uridine(32)-2'-O)-methyltransferase TrmJ n=1 Tax=Coxiella endosymbiont of Ornithodoros maritimus TaxID=1656172 RepID=UPI0022643012|nr:tRNA (cytosine(32)/uridine(32)-2'-O)-methyltransferase TrmJ [Coxiella endosymbiont of Ornithodoros maritimus]